MLNKIKLAFFILFGKGDKLMAMVYVTLLVKGVITYDSIPVLIRPQVNQILVDLDLEYLIPTEE